MINFVTMSYETDGSASLHIVARIEGRNFSYINSEANSTVWPGWFVYLTTVISYNSCKNVVCSCRQHWDSSYYSCC